MFIDALKANQKDNGGSTSQRAIQALGVIPLFDVN